MEKMDTLQLNQVISILSKAGAIETGQLSDTYHTFDELYHHRAILTAALFNFARGDCWKSKKHHDGTMYDGMFIVGINTPYGQASYHYDIDPYWDYFKYIPEKEFAPEFDGHTPSEAIERIARYFVPSIARNFTSGNKNF